MTDEEKEAARWEELEHGIVQSIGTVAHNRRFTAPELADYAKVSREWARAVIRKWEEDGLLERFPLSPGRYDFFPTPAGWAIIEAANG